MLQKEFLSDDASEILEEKFLGNEEKVLEETVEEV